MKITAEFETTKELLDFICTFGPKAGVSGLAKQEVEVKRLAYEKPEEFKARKAALKKDPVLDIVTNTVKVINDKKEVAVKGTKSLASEAAEHAKQEAVAYKKTATSNVVEVHNSPATMIKKPEIVSPIDDAVVPEVDVKVTKEMVREALTKLIVGHKVEEAKALTAEYGASKLGDVEEKDFKAIYLKAKKLLA